MAVVRTAAGIPAAVLRSMPEKTAGLDRIEGHIWRTYQSTTVTIQPCLFEEKFCEFSKQEIRVVLQAI